MKATAPKIIMVAGPNGAGKSTFAPTLLSRYGVTEFVNADTIAQGLSFDPASVALEAGRIMLKRLETLAGRRATFSFETTLASRHYARWVSGLREQAGYEFHLFFVWLRSPELAVQRVQERVRRGGHGVPEADVRRRQSRGAHNFSRLYRPLADSWGVFDNSIYNNPHWLATGEGGERETIFDEEGWQLFCETAK